jgi:hypothetical protein
MPLACCQREGPHDPVIQGLEDSLSFLLVMHQGGLTELAVVVTFDGSLPSGSR